MRKAKDLLGLPIVAFDIGKKIGEVKDTLFSPEHHQVLAFLSDEGGWFEEAKVVPFRTVKSIGRDAVVVPSDMAEIRVSEDDTIKRALDTRRVITNMKVYSEDGRYLGTIEDVVFDESTGEVTGYEVSGGFWEATMKGKRFMPAPTALNIGREVVFVPNETADRMEAEVRGGVMKGVEKAGVTGAAYVGEARKRVQATGERMGAMTKEQQKGFVIGKTVKYEVKAPDGTTLVIPGDNITPDTVERADRLGMLNELTAAVGGAEAQTLLASLQGRAERAYEEARRLITGTAERTQEEAEHRRIKDALGRPVTRVILDINDRVILNTGEIVTNEAIRRAREADVLDILLDSVSKEEPRLGFERRVAPGHGEARLEERTHPEA